MVIEKNACSGKPCGGLFCSPAAEEEKYPLPMPANPAGPFLQNHRRPALYVQPQKRRISRAKSRAKRGACTTRPTKPPPARPMRSAPKRRASQAPGQKRYATRPTKPQPARPMRSAQKRRASRAKSRPKKGACATRPIKTQPGPLAAKAKHILNLPPLLRYKKTGETSCIPAPASAHSRPSR